MTGKNHRRFNVALVEAGGRRRTIAKGMTQSSAEKRAAELRARGNVVLVISDDPLPAGSHSNVLTNFHQINKG